MITNEQKKEFYNDLLDMLGNNYPLEKAIPYLKTQCNRILSQNWGDNKIGFRVDELLFFKYPGYIINLSTSYDCERKEPYQVYIITCWNSIEEPFHNKFVIEYNTNDVFRAIKNELIVECDNQINKYQNYKKGLMLR